jgi:glucose-1-phosphate adenylyltransferase
MLETHSTPKTYTQEYPLPCKWRVDMRGVSTIILCGGEGKRLFPLTLSRCKPAIPFGGRYRLIDIPISNALHSGCETIYLLTQFLSTSLHQHILKTYRMGPHQPNLVEILTVEQKPDKAAWYEGTADAVRQNMEYLKESDSEYFLILSGDQIYQMNFEPMVAFAQETDADLVVAALPVHEEEAKRMGIMTLGKDFKIEYFVEKPKAAAELAPLKNPSRTSWKGKEAPYLGSMGIYLFKRQTLLQLLEEDPREDFGKYLIPTQIKKGGARAYLFSGYWEDVGTVESFYRANMALTLPNPPFSLYSDRIPLYSCPQSLPPPRIANCKIEHSLIGEGSEIEAAAITHSIIGQRLRIGEGTTIEDSYLFGNMAYSPPSNPALPFSIGPHCQIKKALIDKNVTIGSHVKLLNLNGLDSYQKGSIYIRDGIIVVERGTHIPDHFKL